MPAKSHFTQRKNRRTRKKNIQKPTHSRWFYYAFMLINALIWGAAFWAIKPAFEVTTPTRFLFYRYLFASIFGLPIFLYYLPRIKNIWQKTRTVTLLEILGVSLALSFLYAGLERTTSIEAGLLTTTVPIFVVFLGVTFLHEKEEKKEWEGLFLAVIGTLILVLQPLLEGSMLLDHVSLSGNLLIFIHNICIALYYVLAKKYYDPLPKFFVASVSFFVGLSSFFLLGLAELNFSIGTFFTTILAEFFQPSVLFASAYMGILGSVIAFTAYVIGQEGIEASEATLFSYLQPLIYIPLGMIFLGEVIHWQQFFALGLILAGVILGEWKGKQKLQNRKVFFLSSIIVFFKNIFRS